MADSGYCYDADVYCEYCLPVNTGHPEVCCASGESDTPQHCCGCHQPLEYSLTSDGVEYVMEYLRESLEKGPDEWNVIRKDHGEDDKDYYKGCRAIEVERDWAGQLQWYGLSKEDERTVDLFLAVTAEGLSKEDVARIKAEMTAEWAADDADE
jgi:hypothetical protein